MLTDKIGLVFTACHDDEYFIPHFMKYYQQHGIKHFGCVLSFFTCGEENEKTEILKFENFCKEFKATYPNVLVIEKIIENGEYGRMQDWQKLIELMPNTIEYILPADSDELHEFSINRNDEIKKAYNCINYSDINFDLNRILEFIITNKIDVVCGASMERVSLNGEVIITNKEQDIFKQFPCHNKHLYIQPKVSLINKKYFSVLSLGCHNISKEKQEQYNLKIANMSIVHHFRWSAEGKRRMEKWSTRWSSSNWKSWKNVDLIKNKLKVFEHNLLKFTKL